MAAVLSVLSLAALGVYVFGASPAPTLAAQYAPARAAAVSGIVSSSAGQGRVGVVFHDARGRVIGTVSPRMDHRGGFSVPVHAGARYVAVTIAGAHDAISKRYRIHRHQSLRLRAAFPSPGSTLLPGLFAQVG
ncbi:MAG: hypothetical protein ACR2QA_04295 [Solirubrobacteraceae bacterium]